MHVYYFFNICENIEEMGNEFPKVDHANDEEPKTCH